MVTINELLKLVALTHQMRAVERTINIPESDRLENDLEHQYQLAFLAWYIIEAEQLPLDKSKAIEYALVHDAVEAYAGDTFFFDEGVAQSTKDAREREAIQKLSATFPNFPSLSARIADYESRANPESRFIYALDKLITMFNIYLAGGRTWKEHHVTLEKIIEKKQDKVAIDPTVSRLFFDMVERLKKEPGLFSEA